MGRLVDLTHVFDGDMPIYPGDPVPTLTQTARLEVQGFNEFCYGGAFHVGTHMDAPLHMIAEGQRISDISPDRFFGRGVLVDASDALEVTVESVKGLKLCPGDIVVIYTGWYKKFRENSYYGPFPTITSEFAELLIEKKVSILALDTPSPDRPPFPIHKILLANRIPIIENLANVDALLSIGEFDVVALPARFEWEAAPVRVVAMAKSRDQ